MSNENNTSGAELPEALRLAAIASDVTATVQNVRHEIAAELRRLHELAAGQAPAPTHGAARDAGAAERTGCTAGTDEECTRRGCATNCPALRASHGQAPAQPDAPDVSKRRAKYLLNDTDAGRAYVAQFFRVIGRHDFNDYIQTELAGDFACVLASALAAPAPQAAQAPQHAAMLRLAERVARLNPDAGEIGPGMLASLVADARKALTDTEAAPQQVAPAPVGATGHDEADQIINRLMSSDPDFEDCMRAAMLIQREIKGPDGYQTWRDAAVAARAAQKEGETP